MIDFEPKVKRYLRNNGDYIGFTGAIELMEKAYAIGLKELKTKKQKEAYDRAHERYLLKNGERVKVYQKRYQKAYRALSVKTIPSTK